MHNTSLPCVRRPWRLSALAAALVLAFGSAKAQTAADDLRRDLYTPDSKISLGIGNVTGNNFRFGQYNGLSEEGLKALVDFDLIRRDDGTGTWLKLFGRNVGLDNRELRFTHERQGDWAYSLQSQRLVRHEPLQVMSGLQGVGTATQVVSSSAAKRALDLKVERDVFSLAARKYFFGGFDIQASFKQEEGKGARMFGRGTPGVMEFLTEPIDRVTRQWQVVAGYADRKLQLSGGYSGSHYDNHIPVLSSSGGNTASFTALWAHALPPSNSAHQVHLSGGYNISPIARTSFKFARSVAVQNEAFSPLFTRLAGAPDSLNGKLITTLGSVDLNWRPTRQLDMLAALRLEDRDDRTPESRFLNDTPASVGGSFSTSGYTGLVKPRSLKQLNGKLEAAYALDGGYRASAGYEQETLRRTVPSKYRRNAFREYNTEQSTRLDFKRTVAEQLTGGVAVVHSVRGGSEFVRDTFDPNALTNQVVGLIWGDRTRDRLRLNTEWLPDEQWSLQLVADVSKDQYHGRTLGTRSGKAHSLAVDVNYKLSDKWTLTGWASRESTLTRQLARSDRVGNVALGFDTVWSADMRYSTQAVGLGARGKPTKALELGADYSGSVDTVAHNMAKVGGAGTLPVNSLPEYFYRQAQLKLFADYALNSTSGVRVDLIADMRRNNDWTWDNWVYNGAPTVAVALRNSDGSTVSTVPRQNVGFVGVSYRLRFR